MTITLPFSRELQSTEGLALTMETGPTPSISTNTKAAMPVSTSGSSTSWSAFSQSSIGGTLTVTIAIPVNAVIGRYKIGAQVTQAGRTTPYQVGECIVLFNPWVPGDEVFMNNDAERAEYVLNEQGLIFIGSADSIAGRRWDYGQFEEGVVDICLLLLDSSPEYRRNPATDVSKRNDPIYVGRILSAMINSQDDRGVLVGNWSGNYTGGTSPTTWNGSVPILRSWRQNGPVKFGQCWVYGGTLCTVLRCLGIPARVITNFESAHDTNRNLLIEEYFDPYGRNVDSPDSVWNFHVWDEAWFTRKDLGSFYDGWQILDSTPQEPSEGSYRLGPTSQKAIKEGDVNLSFDGPFVLAEVNADRVVYMRNTDGRISTLSTETRSVGQFTSTKAVGSFSRIDVTDQYKYPEGSKENKAVFDKARRLLSGSVLSGKPPRRMAMAAVARDVNIAQPPKPEITGTLKPTDGLQVGDDVVVTLNLKNPSSVTKKVNIKMTGTTIVYNRTKVEEVLNESKSITLAPEEEKEIPLTILYSQYVNAITTDNMIQVVAVCEEENGGNLMVDTVITLKNPPLLLKGSDRAVLEKQAIVDVIFSNPGKENITNCLLILEGSGLLKQPLKIDLPDLKINQRFKTQVEFTPHRTGQRSLMADFSSNKFSDVKAYHNINVVSV
ncbi:hypothetical protein GDO86_014160 [Hymenochirus boettgeri]|uniref:protein-glutamine gamma-glutamyltransferase n=1 Tax=Hymenochirus boettgeri TaxID=247094 RepID=A0A8T2JSZ0_9PIPI|nr:hypothetical protein GDO86_014160 [Hymenochirus boettgeri]